MNAAEQKPWLTETRAMPLRSWSDAQLHDYAMHLQAAVGRWAAAWEVDSVGDATVRCLPAAAPDAQAWSWQALGSHQSAAVWFAQTEDVHDWIAQQLFEADKVRTPVLKTVCEACMRDLRSQLATALRVEGARLVPPPRGEQLGSWCGAVIAILPIPVLVLATGAGVAACVNDPESGKASKAMPASSLTRIDEAVAGCFISLRAAMQPCDLDVGALQRLQPGDVVRLPHALDRPLQIEFDDGHAAFAGALVRKRGARAVELVAAGSLP